VGQVIDFSSMPSEDVVDFIAKSVFWMIILLADGWCVGTKFWFAR
jgi:hypothetical protein